MSFRSMLRPGQGFKPFVVHRSTGGTTGKGRPYKGSLMPSGSFYGMLTEASPQEIEQHKQSGTPITHTILQRGTKDRARAGDVLVLEATDPKLSRKFRVVGDPKNPGDLGHFLIYRVEERKDIEWQT